MSKEDQVPMTGAFLSFAKAIHHAKMLFIQETCMADDLGVEKPEDWHARCEHLFTKVYATQADAIGLKRNRQTFEALIHLEIPEECMKIEYDKLPQLYAFDPWLSMGKGGIVRLSDQQ